MKKLLQVIGLIFTLGLGMGLAVYLIIEYLKYVPE